MELFGQRFVIVDDKIRATGDTVPQGQVLADGAPGPALGLVSRRFRAVARVDRGVSRCYP